MPVHGGLCSLGILAVGHLDKGVALVPVNDAGLHFAVAAKDASEFGLGATERSA